MNFKWKDIVGLSALILGLILSGVSLNHNNTPIENSSIAITKKKQISLEQDQKKRQIQSTNNQVNPGATLTQTPLSRKNILKLIECYQTEDCDYPNNDPREYKLSVGQGIKNELNMAYKKILRGESIDTIFWTKIAITSLSIADGHVKEAALDVISTQEPSQEAFDKILSEVINYHDPLLIAQALTELQKYTDPKHKIKIYKTLSQVLSTGSVLVKNEVAYNIFPFLNKDSLPYFKSSLKKMNSSSNTHTVLFKILRDYSQQQTGA